jgi:hypothetical protein
LESEEGDDGNSWSEIRPQRLITTVMLLYTERCVKLPKGNGNF